MESDVWGQIIIIAILVGINAFFAASEIAIISLNDAKVERQSDEGDKIARVLDKLIKEPSRFLSTVQVGMTVSGLLASAMVALLSSRIFPALLSSLNLHYFQKSSEEISVLIGTAIISYIILVVGELAPKRLALEKAEGIARFVAKPVDVVSRITSPFVKVLTVSTNFIVRLAGGNPDVNQSKITEEEIRMMINVGEEKGVLMEREKEMIDSIFEFDDTFAKEVMTPRIDMICIPADAKLDDIVDLTVKEQFSRIPVYDGNIDNIIGILNVKDLFQVYKFNREDRFNLKDFIRPALFVPENQKTDELLRQLQARRTEIAIVIDEYGGTAGLITTEDLVEEIFGNILDEYDEEEKEIEKIDDSTYIVSGLLSVDEVNDELDLRLNEEGADTIGGFVLGLMGKIPEPDESPVVEYEDLIFKVEEMDDRRAARIKIAINKNIEDING